MLFTDAVTTKPIDVKIQRVFPAVSDSLGITRDTITGSVIAYNALRLKELHVEVPGLAFNQQQNSHLLKSLLSLAPSYQVCYLHVNGYLNWFFSRCKYCPGSSTRISSFSTGFECGLDSSFNGFS